MMNAPMPIHTMPPNSGDHQPLIGEEAAHVTGVDHPHEREDDERQRADDVGRSLGFRAHRADLEHHLRALAQHVGEVRQRLGEIAAGLALDGERDHEELELRGAEPIGGVLERGLPSSCRSSSCRRPCGIRGLPGPVISLATMPSVSVIGRPERSPRTISSIASGKFVLNFLIRRLIILPMTKCGPPTPKNMPMSIDSRKGAPRNVSASVMNDSTPTQTVAYLAERDVLAGHLQPLAQQRGLGDQASRHNPPSGSHAARTACGSALARCRRSSRRGARG